MNKENVFFTACGLALGLVVGSFLIGPHLARTPLAGNALSAAGIGVGQANAGGVTSDNVVNAMPGSPMAGANSPMMQVKQRIESLKQAAAANPSDPDPLVQLGNMYMDVGKYPQAVDYFEQALRLREDSNVRTDLGICYKQSGQQEKAVAAFTQVEREQPDQWQAVYNAAIVYAEAKNFPEAQARLAKLEKMQPGNPDIAKLRSIIAAR